jgi:hypothetical protein
MMGVSEGNETTDWKLRTHLEDFEVRAAQRTEDGGEHGGEVSRPTWNCYRGRMRVRVQYGCCREEFVL